MNSIASVKAVPTSGQPAAKSVPQRSAIRAWLVAVMLVLLALVNWADKAVLGLVAVPLTEDLNLSPEQYGLLASALYFLFSISAVGAGFLANKVATRWLLFAMVVIWSLAQFSIWLAPSFAMILLSRIILGFSGGPSAGLSFHSVAKWFKDDDRTIPTALQNVGSFGGITIAAPVVTWIAMNFSWRWAFFAVGAAGVVWLALWLVIGKEGPYSPKESQEPTTATNSATTNTAEEPLSETTKRVPYRVIFLSRTFIGVCCVSFSAYWALAVVSAWLPTYLNVTGGFGMSGSANIVAMVSMTAIVFLVGEALLTTWLMKKGVASRIARGFMAAGTTLVAGLFILASTVTPPGGLQIAFICLGFGMGLVSFTTGSVTISEFVPALQRGAAQGLYVGIITSAGVVAPLVFGTLVGAGATTESGYGIAFVVSGLVVTVGGVLGLLLIHPQRDLERVTANLRERTSPMSTPA